MRSGRRPRPEGTRLLSAATVRPINLSSWWITEGRHKNETETSQQEGRTKEPPQILDRSEVAGFGNIFFACRFGVILCATA